MGSRRFVPGAEIFPEWNESWLYHDQNVIYYAGSLPYDASSFADTIKHVDEMLSADWPNDPLTDRQRGFAFDIRAQCHQFLGEIDAAESDYNESIAKALDEPRWYLNLGADSGMNAGAAILPRVPALAQSGGRRGNQFESRKTV